MTIQRDSKAVLEASMDRLAKNFKRLEIAIDAMESRTEQKDDSELIAKLKSENNELQEEIHTLKAYMADYQSKGRAALLRLDNTIEQLETMGENNG